MSWLLFLAGCPPDDGKDSGGDFGDTIYLREENNYSFAGELTFGYQEVQLGEDVLFTWDQMTTDIQGHEFLGCDEVDELSLIWFRYLTYDDLIDKTTCDNIFMSDAEVIALGYEDHPSDCEMWMSEFVVPPSNPFYPETYFVSDEGVWFMRITTGSTDTRMATLIVPSETSTNHEVDLQNDSSSLSFSGSIGTTITVPPAPSYIVDWSLLLEGAASDGCEPSEISSADQLWIARYSGLTIADLEAELLDLELLAEEVYVADAGGITNVPLESGATNLADGSAFPGFGAGELWVIALRATYSNNPAPVFLGAVEVGG